MNDLEAMVTVSVPVRLSDYNLMTKLLDGLNKCDKLCTNNKRYEALPFQGYGDRDVIDPDEAFWYAIDKCLLSGDTELMRDFADEVVEWFYSGNYVVLKDGEE